jgi:signal transduction histidine kinase
MLVDAQPGGSRNLLRAPSTPARYGYAIVAAFAATAARVVLASLFGYQHQYAMFYTAVLWSAWYGGLGPGLVTTALGALSVAISTVQPGLFTLGFHKANLTGLEFYVLVTVTTVLLFESERRSRRRAIEAEQQLREAQKLESIGMLAGGIAHDFNNILTGVLGNASLLIELVPAEGRARRLIDSLMQSAERAAQLTRQLLAYAGKGNFVRQPVDFSAAARQAAEAVRATAGERIQLRLDLAAGLPPVMADATQIQQMIAGLAQNAVEAIGGGEGTVTIRTGHERREPGTAAVGRIEGGDYVVVAVSDTGCGMDEPTRQRIFDPFFTTKFMGRGLGLAAVAGIVRTLDGAVTVASELGRGTTVEVVAPVRH